MNTLPFRLKVPNRDEISPLGVSSTAFTFHGLLQLLDDGVRLTWNGTAKVDKFGFTGVGENIVPLPEESLELGFERLRDVAVHGSWLLPRLLLMGSDFDALRIVPSEEGGRVSLWLARRDLRLARDLAQRMRARL